MIRYYPLIFSGTFLASTAFAQSAGTSAAAPTVPTLRPAHSDELLPPDGTKANPADVGSPPLADPLKQQAVTDPPQTLATPAVQFIMQASMHGTTQVQLAQMALKRSSTARIRRFARRMVAGYESLDAKLEVLATQRGTSIAHDSDPASSVQHLGTISGRLFDKAYATEVLAAHDRAIALYSAATSLSDVQLAQFASGALPMLRGYRTQAAELEPGATPR